MKIASIVRALDKHGGFHRLLVHTGQHYDDNMSKLFFEELNIPAPDMNLGVGSASQAVQTAEVMRRFEPVVLDFKPDYVLVVGDVNSTIACGLVAVKLGVKVAHVEAGLRSFDRSMPEEINRVLTDSISSLLFVTEQSAIANLLKEGIHPDKVHFVGNVMIDTLLSNRRKAECSDILERLGLLPKSYGVITLHRPSNVDDKNVFDGILKAFEEIQKEIKLVFPVHPRTYARIKENGFSDIVSRMKNLVLLEPLGYLDFLQLTDKAFLVMTDSGGIQEETTILKVPCLTLRNNTERPVTITEGTNKLVPPTMDGILASYREVKNNVDNIISKTPELWDGKSADRIIELVYQDWKRSHSHSPL